MTKEQQEATRLLMHAEYCFLSAYGWQREPVGSRVSHWFAPKAKPTYSVRDAVQMTRSEPLRYSASVSRVEASIQALIERPA